MSAFELDSLVGEKAVFGDCGEEENKPGHDRSHQECVIAYKVYDSCRNQNCIKPSELGAVRAAEKVCIGDERLNEGDVICPPRNAAAVTIDKFKVKKITIVNKEKNPFKNGYWDIDVKYVFEYYLTFREADGTPIEPGQIKACSIYNKRVALFGADGADIVISSDLPQFMGHEDSDAIEAGPYVLVEAKAVALEVSLKNCGRNSFNDREDIGGRHHPSSHDEVLITIGLFTIIELYRIVSLAVESNGFYVPHECIEISPIHPCEVFENVAFPMDIFAPPLMDEFNAGSFGTFSSDREKKPCGCDK